MFQRASDLYFGIILNDPSYRCRGGFRVLLVSGYSQISVPKAWGSGHRLGCFRATLLRIQPHTLPRSVYNSLLGVGGKSRTTDERPHRKGDRATSASWQGRVVWLRGWQSAHVTVYGGGARQTRSVLTTSTRSQIIMQMDTVAGPEESRM